MRPMPLHRFLVKNAASKPRDVLIALRLTQEQLDAMDKRTMCHFDSGGTFVRFGDPPKKPGEQEDATPGEQALLDDVQEDIQATTRDEPCPTTSLTSTTECSEEKSEST